MDRASLEKALELTKNANFIEAEKIYTDLLEKEPENSVLLSTVGLFYITLGDYGKASYYLEKSCSIKETAGNLVAYGISEFERKNFRNSAIILVRALEFVESEEIYQNLLTSLFKRLLIFMSKHKNTQGHFFPLLHQRPGNIFFFI